MGKEDCLKIAFFLKKEKTNKFHCIKNVEF